MKISPIKIKVNKLSPGNSWIAWLVSAITAIIASIIIPLLINYYPRSVEEAKFIIVNSFLRSDSILIIKANNKKANQKKKLDVIIDGHPFPEAGILSTINDKGMYKWQFSLKQYKHAESILKNRKHWVQVGFPGKKRSQKFDIYFINELLIMQEPKFIIVNSILRSDSTLIIKANNKKANQKRKLDIIFDGYPFPEAGILCKFNDKDMYQWKFSLIKHTKEESLTNDGEHQIKVSFPGEKLSDEYKIRFVNDQPIVDAEIIKKDSKTNILKGKATTKTQIPENEIKVDVTFYHEGSKEEQINVPIKKVEYQDTGLMFFEFETKLENFPEISTEDNRYSEIFFSLKVTDKAENEYYYEESYGQYVTGGIKRFGALNIDFRIDRNHDDVSKSLNSAFFLKPRKQLNQSLKEIPKIILKVTSRIVNRQSIRRLDWKNNIPKPKPLAFIYRDGKKIGNSEANSNSYTDTEELNSEIVEYYIEIEDEYRKMYKSNTEVFDTKRSNPKSITKATLTVRSNVYNDTVYINGKEYGSTRLDVKLPLGKYKLQVEKTGYSTFEKFFNFNKDTTVRAELEPKKIAIIIITDPKDAKVFVNNLSRGSSPITLNMNPGKYKIEALKNGYESHQENVTIKAGQNFEKKIYLKKSITKKNKSTNKLETAEKKLDKDPLNVPINLNKLAGLFEAQGKYAEAEPLYIRSLEINEKSLGKDHPNVATTLNNLANLYNTQGKYEEAEPLYKRSLEIRKTKLGKDHPDVAATLNSLAKTYYYQKNYQKSEYLYKKSLEIRETKLGKDHLDTANTLINLADLYKTQGKNEKAESLYERGLAIKEAYIGKDHPDMFSGINNLAELYMSIEKYEEAESLYKRGLEIIEVTYGKSHPKIGNILYNLSNLYRFQGKNQKKTLNLYKRSLEINEKSLGKDHPIVATTLNNLGEIYASEWEYEKAELLYKRSLEIRETKLGKDHPDVATTLNNLGKLYFYQAKYKKAEYLYKRSLEIREIKFGKKHPNLGIILNNLAELYRFQDKYDEAELLYKRALYILKARYGEYHTDVLTTVKNLAMLYWVQGNYKEAESLYKKAIEMTDKIFGKNHPNYKTIINSYSQLLLDISNKEKSSQ